MVILRSIFKRSGGRPVTLDAPWQREFVPPLSRRGLTEIDYSSFEGSKYPQRPCFLDKGRSKPDAMPCAKLRLPTADEIAAHEKWLDGRMGKLGVVMKGILPWRQKNEGRSAQEVIECPACKGRLHLSIAAYNGHVHGQCETDGCVSWVE
jgi:hypothetical protein